jgi:transglutaminase-like putative cysteine protease
VSPASGGLAGLAPDTFGAKPYRRGQYDIYTADLRPDRIAEFLLLFLELPRSVRFSAARVDSALRIISQLTNRGAGGRAERLAGRLHASLDYGQVDEILGDDPHTLLDDFASEIGLERTGDPLATLKRLMAAMHARFEYSPRTTRVDSPIDEALQARRGVCQDFAHVMIALVRRLNVPCRYVSGYLFQSNGGETRSSEVVTHA